jgi:mono/diheme cytochrome c family protein
MITRAIAVMLLLTATACFAEEGELSSPEQKGKVLAERLCAGCHAVGPIGDSTHARAPPFRTLNRRVKIDANFVNRLRKGLIVGDPDMPSFRFNDDVTQALVAYITAIQQGKTVTTPGPPPREPIPRPPGETRFRFDAGGKIDEYIEKFNKLASSNVPILIDGYCAPACTVVLGIVPLDRICVTGRARFGFHAAVSTDEDGRLTYDDAGTQVFLDTYPKPLRDWIVKNGGLTGHVMMYLSGVHLKTILPDICYRPDTTVPNGPEEVVVPAPPAGRS